MKNVAIFGDSIFRGVMIDSVTKKYVFSKSINWKGLEEKCDVKLTNFAKMGSTITHGYPRLKSYLEGNPEVDVILLEYGGNDSDFDWLKVSNERSRKHTCNTNMDDFERMYNEMLDWIIARGIKPIMANLPPIHSGRYFSWITRNGANKKNIMYFLRDKETIYRRQEIFSAKVVEIANKRSIELVDVRSKFLASDNYIGLVCEDGIHPNVKGEDLIVQCFIEKYQKKDSVKDITEMRSAISENEAV